MMGGEQVLDSLQTRSIKFFAVQPDQQRTQKPNIFECTRSRFEDLFRWLAKNSKDDSLNDENHEERRFYSQLSPNHGRNNGHNSQDQSEPSQALAGELIGGLCPSCQRVRMHA